MNKELLALIVTTTGLAILGLAAIVFVVIHQPAIDNSATIKEITGFIAIIILQFISLAKNVQNSGVLQEVKISSDGQNDHAVQQAVKLATLTEKVESAKTAAVVAAKIVIDTAEALKLKKES